MPAYAILGATGQTGGSILQVLLQNAEQTSTTVHCFVRSRNKLISQITGHETNPAIKNYTGSATDAASLLPCVKDTTAIFACAASGDNVPGISIALDTAHALIAALYSDPQGRPWRKSPSHSRAQLVFTE